LDLLLGLLLERINVATPTTQSGGIERGAILAVIW